MDISIFDLKVALRYDPETGKLHWRWRHEVCQHINCRFAGHEALITTDKDGRRRGIVNGQSISANRAAWALYWGDWPDGKIINLNGNLWDNRIENLELGKNLRADNTSGHAGVYWNKHAGQWMAYLGNNKSMKYLGRFDEIVDAIAARKAAE